MILLAVWPAAAIILATLYGGIRARARATEPTADDTAFLTAERHRFDQLIASLDLPRSPE